MELLTLYDDDDDGRGIASIAFVEKSWDPWIIKRTKKGGTKREAHVAGRAGRKGRVRPFLASISLRQCPGAPYSKNALRRVEEGGAYA
jgi:hypothetical protein